MAEQDPELSTARWSRVRELFDAVCDLPDTRQRERLSELGVDAATADEVLGLVHAQTETFARAVAPLQALAAGLDREELAIGTRIGVWTLTARLARGGMGSVYVAERSDALFRQKVAIKVLDAPQRDGAADRFAEERALLAGLVHPDIARLYDGGTTAGGLPFLVMEFIDGLPLDRYAREHGLGLDARIALFERVAAAVAFAHQRLVIHCDLKPENVLVRADGSPALLDFGIARLADHDEGSEGWCTPAYASPEQIAGKRLGTASDVFSLGVMLAELLADRRYGRTAADADTPLIPPSAAASDAARAWVNALRGDLDAIVAKATQADPAKRYPVVAEMLADLRRRREHRPVHARPSTATLRLGRFLRRQWRSAAAGLVLLAVIGAFSLQLVRERDRAREAAETAQATSDFLVEAFAAADPRQSEALGQASARDVLDAGAARIATDLADRPAVRAQLLLAIGGAYRNLGLDAKAEPMLAEAAALFLSPAVDRPLDASEALQQQSVIAGNSHRGAEAVRLAEEAEALRVAGGDDSVEGRGDSLNHLGVAYTAAGDFDRARMVLAESVALRRTRADIEPLDLLVGLNNLARAERGAGRLDAAEALYAEVVRKAEAMGPRADPSRQTALDFMARVRSDRGDRLGALPLLQDSLALAQRLYGDTSSRTATAHNELANVLHDVGRLDEAEVHYRRSLAIEGEVRGDGALPYAVALNNLASLLEDRGRFRDAATLSRRSLAIREASLPTDDPMVLRSRGNLARLLVRDGQLDEAARLLGPVLELVRGAKPDADPERVRFELLQAQWLIAARRIDEAEAALAAIVIPDDPGRARDRLARDRVRIELDAARGRHAEALARADALDAELAAAGAAPLERLRNDALRERLRAGNLARE